MKKQILKLFHKFKLCPKLKHPWGYNCNKYKINKNIICPYFKSKDNREFLNQLTFKTHSTNAYKLIYNSYLLNIDFLDYNYTTPSLSLALNELRNKSNIDNLPTNINIKNVVIIDSWYEYGITKSNDKFMGMYNKSQIVHEITAGILGPEAFNIWDQQGIKQKIKILYESDHYLDVIEWERDMMLPNQVWQVCNINQILI